MIPIPRRATGPLICLLVLALAACSDSGPSGLSDPLTNGMSRITGQITAGGGLAADLGRSARGLELSDHDDFVGEASLVDVKITILDGDGNEILSTTTDLEGEFEGTVPPGTYTVVLELDPETQFTFTIDVPEGTTFFVQGKLDVNPSGKFTLDAEIFVDNDGDGEPDNSFRIRITGRVSGLPQSGDVDIEGAGDQVPICHFPPGHPENFHTILVGPAAVAAHLDHGDTEGPCDDDDLQNGGDDGNGNGDGEGDGEKATICHVPPGRPENASTLHVDPDDVQEHLDHGDTEGACEGDGGGA